MMQKLNLYINNNFLTETECKQNIELLKTNVLIDSRVDKSFYLNDVEKSIRKSKQQSFHSSIEYKNVFNKILNEKKKIDLFFSTDTISVEKLQHLHYSKGDYFLPHNDKPHFGTNASRKLTLVIFLNNQCINENRNNQCFQGGELIIYGIKNTINAKSINIKSKTCTLIAFESHLTHEVTEVIEGSRYTIITWLK